MKGLLFFFIFCLPLVSSAQKIWLMVGEQKILPKTAGMSVTLTNPQVVTVKQVPKGLLLIAKKSGKAFLTAGNKKNFEILVYPTKFEPARKALEKLVEGTDLTLDISPTAITVEGVAQRFEDWVEVSAIKNLYPKIVKLQFTALPEVLKKVQADITKQLKARSIFASRVEISNQRLRMTNTSKDKRESRVVAQIADQWGLGTVEYSGSLELRPMVEVDVTIAEVKKSSVKNLGLSTPGSYSAIVIPSSNLGTFDTTYDSSSFKLNTLIENQMGKVIANPKLLCRSGEVANFIAGGEIPIKVSGWKTAEVTWKKYGVILNITPLADIQNGISTKLVTEVSLLDEAHKIEGIPGLLTNRIETHFDLRGEKTIALSGLIKNEIGRGSQDTPLLSAIPLLGELFKSKDYRENKSELIIFVTPRVITPDNPPHVQVNGFWTKDDDI